MVPTTYDAASKIHAKRKYAGPARALQNVCVYLERSKLDCLLVLGLVPSLQDAERFVEPNNKRVAAASTLGQPGPYGKYANMFSAV